MTTVISPGTAGRWFSGAPAGALFTAGLESGYTDPGPLQRPGRRRVRSEGLRRADRRAAAGHDRPDRPGPVAVGESPQNRAPASSGRISADDRGKAQRAPRARCAGQRCSQPSGRAERSHWPVARILRSSACCSPPARSASSGSSLPRPARHRLAPVPATRWASPSRTGKTQRHFAVGADPGRDPAAVRSGSSRVQGGSGQALSASGDARAGACRLRRPVTKDARRDR